MSADKLHQSLADRLQAKLVERPNGCIEFTGYRGTHGYGSISLGGGSHRPELTHRVAWELAHGPIPDGMYVCHRCDNRPCCNVDHLFLGTQADNMRDMAAKGRSFHAAKTHCPRGHPYSAENVRYVSRGKGRVCRTCRSEKDKAQRRQLKERST